MSDYYQDEDFGPLFTVATPQAAPEPECTNDCKRLILERLKQGPATCREIDRLTPARGQALIGTMRTDGYRIKTKLLEDERCYVYEGFGETIRVAKTMQEAYYQTPHWRQMAMERKDIDSHRCRQCGTGGSQENRLETHHWVYELFSEDVNRELITFCKRCHGNVHEWIRGGACHFPRCVSEDVARKLGWEPKE